MKMLYLSSPAFPPVLLRDAPRLPPLIRGGHGGSGAGQGRLCSGACLNPPVPPLRKGGSFSLRGAQQIEPPCGACSAKGEAEFSSRQGRSLARWSDSAG